MKVSREMIEEFIGCDENPIDILEDIANGSYKTEQFIEDIIEYNLERN